MVGSIPREDLGMNLDDLASQLAQLWRAHGYQLLIAAMVATAGVLVWTLLRARRRGATERWVSTVAGIAVLGLSAEGMWVVAREKLGLAPVLAGVVFFVFEALMLSSAMQAHAQYGRTTRRDDQGRIVLAGHPGRHGTTVWVIAAVAGVVVSLNSKSFVEVVLRIALPLLAALMWWNALTAEGTSRPQGSWRWTPRRLLVWVGALEPTERDLEEITRERRVSSMTLTARRLHRGGPLTRWHAARLERLALAADDAMMTEVRARVVRAHSARALTDPSGGQDQTEPDGFLPAGPAAAPAAEAGPARSPERRSRPAPVTRSDEELLAQFGAQLAGEYRAAGRLSEYRVRRVCGVTARPSARLREEIIRRVEAERENGHPLTLVGATPADTKTQTHKQT